MPRKLIRSTLIHSTSAAHHSRSSLKGTTPPLDRNSGAGTGKRRPHRVIANFPRLALERFYANDCGFGHIPHSAWLKNRCTAQKMNDRQAKKPALDTPCRKGGNPMGKDSLFRCLSLASRQKNFLWRLRMHDRINQQTDDSGHQDDQRLRYTFESIHNEQSRQCDERHGHFACIPVAKQPRRPKTMTVPTIAPTAAAVTPSTKATSPGRFPYFLKQGAAITVMP